MKKIIIKPGEIKTMFLDTIKNVEINLGEYSILTIVTILEKGWDETRKMTFNLTEEYAILNLIGIIVGQKNNKFDFEITASHTAPNTIFSSDFRSILLDQSEINSQGRLIIEQTADNTESFLNHHSMNFSETAKFQTIPSLEIKTNNVKAGHSVTIGKIDNNQILYMKSRGLNEKTTKKLLIESFLKTDLDKVKDKKTKQFVINKLDRLKLGKC